MKNNILAFFIVLMFLSISLFAEEKTEEKHFMRTSTEWLSFSTGYGTYGSSLNFSAFTLRWRNVFWEILKLHASYDFSYPINSDENVEYNQSSDYNVFSFKIKSSAGIPFFITDDNRHEIRVGGGVGIGLSCYKKDGHVLDVSTELSYIAHVTDFLAFQLGVSADFPLFTDKRMFPRTFNINEYKSIYMPNVYGFVGVRF